MAEEYDLIQIKDFNTAGAASNNDFLPISQSGITRRIGLDVLVSVIISLNNILKQSDVVNNLTTESTAKPLSALQGKILNSLIEGFASQVGTGIIGEAKPDTIPISEGFGIYTTSTAGIYSDFLDINENPIQVFESDLSAGSGGLVQLWGNSNVWEKHVTVIDNITLPTPSNETFIIL